MTSSAAIPEGPGSASGAPNLPYGFAGTFTSRYIDTGDVRLHAVTGGEGPPLLLVHGWPISRSSVLRSLSRSMIPVVPSGRPESVVISSALRRVPVAVLGLSDHPASRLWSRSGPMSPRPAATSTSGCHPRRLPLEATRRHASAAMATSPGPVVTAPVPLTAA
jgi:hypothetical protein